MRLENNEQENEVYEEISQRIEQSIEVLALKGSGTEEALLGQLTLLDSIKIYQPDIKISNAENWLNPLYEQPHCNSTSAAIYRISNKLCPV